MLLLGLNTVPPREQQRGGVLHGDDQVVGRGLDRADPARVAGGCVRPGERSQEPGLQAGLIRLPGGQLVGDGELFTLTVTGDSMNGVGASIEDCCPLSIA
ncbi:hypothetical protein ACIRRH_39265 [Kitasatospora sp. NPDC101235]|uniref:hypothetical protein n=1 Tax=Kitasatospora sp. NPDC101235 TaxID=3364101 RepID=UPI0037FF0B05